MRTPSGIVDRPPLLFRDRKKRPILHKSRKEDVLLVEVHRTSQTQDLQDCSHSQAKVFDVQPSEDLVEGGVVERSGCFQSVRLIHDPEHEILVAEVPQSWCGGCQR